MKKIVLILLCVIVPFLWAHPDRDPSNLAGAGLTAAGNTGSSSLPLNRVVILTSGLAYYEHSGQINGNVNIDFPFRLDAVNDALKTLIINDPSSANPSVAYQSEQTLYQTLRSLSIDLSDQPNLALILSRLRGVEIEIYSPTLFSGRVVGIEYRTVSSGFMASNEPWLLLNTSQGLRSFNMSTINSIRFLDPVVEQDLNRALDLIASSRNSFSRLLTVNLPGNDRRDVTVSYVIPSPVWKVSYRLDLGSPNPLFQGWAIVDNDSDNDWNDVTLSLVAGRPTSFIQNLYPPYYVSRPTLPLSIAGVASATTHDQSYPMPSYAPVAEAEYMMMNDTAFSGTSMMRAQSEPPMMAPAPTIAGGNVQTAAGSAAGGQFEFTIRNPVNLNRRMSAMLPLVESAIDARKILIYNGGRHPRLGAEITNTTGMKLPAGPITVYDQVYAGDALLEFWNEDEKRLISFGDDLSVTAVSSDTNTRLVSSVTVSGGVMTINRNVTFIKTYTFINSGSESKMMIVEHNKTTQTDLISPVAFEQTATTYRFEVTLPPHRETILTVSEQRPISERITLLSMRQDTFLSYITNHEIPANVRQVLQQAVELRQAADAATLAVRDIETQRSRLIADQDRIRRNLEAVGSQTSQGQEYLNRLTSMDNEIDTMTLNLDTANRNARTAQQAYESFIAGINLQ